MEERKKPRFPGHLSFFGLERSHAPKKASAFHVHETKGIYVKKSNVFVRSFANKETKACNNFVCRANKSCVCENWLTNKE